VSKTGLPPLLKPKGITRHNPSSFLHQPHLGKVFPIAYEVNFFNNAFFDLGLSSSVAQLDVPLQIPDYPWHFFLLFRAIETGTLQQRFFGNSSFQVK